MTVKETSSKISQYGEHKNLIGLFLNSKVDKKNDASGEWATRKSSQVCVRIIIVEEDLVGMMGS